MQRKRLRYIFSRYEIPFYVFFVTLPLKETNHKIKVLY